MTTLNLKNRRGVGSEEAINWAGFEQDGAAYTAILIPSQNGTGSRLMVHAKPTPGVDMGTLNANLNYLGQELSGELKGSYQGSGVNAKMTNVHRNALPVGLDSNARKILESVSGSHWRSYDLNGSSPTGNKLIRAVRRFSDDVSALVVA